MKLKETLDRWCREEAKIRGQKFEGEVSIPTYVWWVWNYFLFEKGFLTKAKIIRPFNMLAGVLSFILFYPDLASGVYQNPTAVAVLLLLNIPASSLIYAAIVREFTYDPRRTFSTVTIYRGFLFCGGALMAAPVIAMIVPPIWLANSYVKVKG